MTLSREAGPFALAAREARLLVKICGITRAEDARAAVDAGADALGFVFWPASPRAVTAEAAARIAAEIPPHVLRVGLFVEATLEEQRRTADQVGLDVLQWYGPLSPEDCAQRPRPVLQAIRVAPDFRAEDATAYAFAAGVLLDTYRKENLGGTGAAFDWTRVLGLRDRLPFLMLAGGLRPDNVREAIRVVQPHGVDVSSGVEASPGRKDADKMRAFVAAARGASSPGGADRAADLRVAR